jgi:hypothetical protein
VRSDGGRRWRCCRQAGGRVGERGRVGAAASRAGGFAGEMGRASGCGGAGGIGARESRCSVKSEHGHALGVGQDVRRLRT